MELLNKLGEKIGFGKIFFIIVLILYFILFFLDQLFFTSVFSNFIKIILNVWWVIAIVFAFTFIVNLLLNEKKIVALVGKESGLKGWIIALFGGLISHGPIYLWFPLLSGLKEKGMKNELITTFLYNRAVKIPLLPLMIFYFGLTFTIVLTFWMIIFSVINGKIVGAFCNENSNK